MSTIYDKAPLPILESRLDWLTVTVKSDKIRAIVRDRVDGWMAKRKALGYTERAFKTPFYEGHQVGGISCGNRRDDMLINLTGKMAQEHGPVLITWADNVSRIDAQVTLQDPDLTHAWAHYVNQLALLHPSVRNNETHTRFITSTPDGSTAYIGSPGSTRMLRCYDKTAESGNEYPPGCWRWEVQWRHARAKHTAEQLTNRSSSPAAILATVCAAYKTYGVDVPAVCPPIGWKDANIQTKTDVERQLLWLKTSIAPCVGRLIDAVGLKVVMEALDLGAVIDTLEGAERAINFGLSGGSLENLVADDQVRRHRTILGNDRADYPPTVDRGQIRAAQEDRASKE